MAETGAWYAGQGNTALVGRRLSMLIQVDPRGALASALWPAVAASELPAVLTMLTSQGMTALPSFALVQGRPEGLLLLVRGVLTAAVYRGTSLIETVSAGDVTTWREVTFAGADRAVLSVSAAGQPLLPLLAGVVEASHLECTFTPHLAAGHLAQPPAFVAALTPLPDSAGRGLSAPSSGVLGPISAAHAPVTREWKEPVAAKPLPPGTMLDRLSFLDSVAPASQTHYGDTVSAKPRTGVAAVRCPKLHLNPPATPVCRECLLPLDPAQEPFFVPQPVVGQLRRQNSMESYPLGKRVTLLGRSPGSAAVAQGDEVQLVSLSGVSEAISDVHAEVRLEGWRVEVIGRGDTLITNPGDGPVRLEPGVPMRLLLGGKLQLAGEVSLVFGL